MLDFESTSEVTRIPVASEVCDDIEDSTTTASPASPIPTSTTTASSATSSATTTAATVSTNLDEDSDNAENLGMLMSFYSSS